MRWLLAVLICLLFRVDILALEPTSKKSHRPQKLDLNWSEVLSIGSNRVRSIASGFDLFTELGSSRFRFGNLTPEPFTGSEFLNIGSVRNGIELTSHTALGKLAAYSSLAPLPFPPNTSPAPKRAIRGASLEPGLIKAAAMKFYLQDVRDQSNASPTESARILGLTLNFKPAIFKGFNLSTDVARSPENGKAGAGEAIKLHLTGTAAKSNIALTFRYIDKDFRNPAISGHARDRRSTDLSLSRQFKGLEISYTFSEARDGVSKGKIGEVITESSRVTAKITLPGKTIMSTSLNVNQISAAGREADQWAMAVNLSRNFKSYSFNLAYLYSLNENSSGPRINNLIESSGIDFTSTLTLHKKLKVTSQAATRLSHDLITNLGSQLYQLNFQSELSLYGSQMTMVPKFGYISQGNTLRAIAQSKRIWGVFCSLKLPKKLAKKLGEQTLNLNLSQEILRTSALPYVGRPSFALTISWQLKGSFPILRSARN